MNETIKNRLIELLNPSVDNAADLEQKFNEIARILLLQCEIAIGNDIRYSIEEIEFYYFKNGCLDGSIYNCSYPRNRKACDFYWHYSGIDICFESTEDSFGGVLIRALRKIEKKDGVKTDVLIGGPMRCALDLTNTCFSTGNQLELVFKEEPRKAKILNTIRQGIKADYKVEKGELIPIVQYCYYIPQPNADWKRKRKALVLSSIPNESKERKRFEMKSNVVDYYNDNPEERIKNLKQKLNKKN